MARQMFYERFNDKCDEFCKDIISSFPNIDQFKHIRSGLTLVKNIDLKSPQHIFYKNIYKTPYKKYILDRNEQFFLSKNEFTVSHSNNEKQEYWDEFIENLRVIWSTLSEQDKDNVWKYFHILLILSEKCQDADKIN